MEIEELRAKAIASMPSSSNPNPNPNPKLITTEPLSNREEGEVSSSSSDDEKLPAPSPAQTNVTFPANSMEPASVVPKEIKTLNSMAVGLGQLGQSSSSARAANSQKGRSTGNYLPATVPILVQASGAMPFKSKPCNMPGWFAPSEANDNLVIRFSDDDSESDLEESKPRRSGGKKDSSLRTDKHMMPVPLSQLRSASSQRSLKNQMGAVPKKASTTHVFLSSVAKKSGTHPRLPGNSRLGQKFHIQTHNFPSKSIGSHGSGFARGIGLTDSRMENLRQQIASRENELKLQHKFLPEGKERFPGSGLDSDRAKAGRPLSVNTADLPPDGQQKKRIKLDKSIYSVLHSDGQMQKVLPTSKGPHASNSFSNETMVPQNLVSANQGEATSNSIIPPETCDRIGIPADVPESVDLGTHDRLMDIQNLVKIMKSQDRELEEAQKLRCKFELEERHALKAYFKAQKALFDANERCGILYQRRELFSAKLRSFSMEYSSMWSSKLHGHGTNEYPRASLENLPCSGPLMQADCDGLDQNLRSEACSEPGDSASEPLFKGDAVERTVDEDDETSFDHNKVQCELASKNEKESLLLEGAVDVSGKPGKKSAMEIAQDYSLLEASLRSELFARLGANILSKSSGCYSGDHTVNQSADHNLDKIEKTHLSTGKLSALSSSSSLEIQRKSTDSKGIERSHCEYSGQIHHQSHGDQFCFDYNDPDEIISPREEYHKSTCTSVDFLPSSDLKVVFRHVKIIFPENRNGVLHEEAFGFNSYENRVDVSTADVRESGTISGKIEKLEPGICDLAIDPFWPLCMFELRGKCNHRECPWQHARDYSQRDTMRLNGSFVSDDPDIPSSITGQLTRSQKLSHSLHRYIITIPTYRIGSNLVKADKHPSGYALARIPWQYYQMGFCSLFAIPLSVQRILPPDVPFLHERDGCVEDNGGWKRLSLYGQSQDDTLEQIMQGLTGTEQCLEMALDLFNGNANKLEGKIKRGFLQSLSVLSRALEAAPNSTALWVVYLHIYYRKEKTIGKDDMFLLAVQHNVGSYELWLLFINSRDKLKARLDAYDTALSALCCRACEPDKDYASACILDLSLKMLDFLRMSGYTGEATSRIHQLLPSDVSLDSSQAHISLSEIMECLKVSDKCVLWVCCVYFTIYKKLPESVLQKFELEQELPFGVHWPSIQLPAKEKHQALGLMKKAVHTLALGLDVDDGALKPLHALAVSHVKCVAALNSLDGADALLAEYRKLYPTCVELVLASARMQGNHIEDVGFKVFEEALDNWPKEVPGIQCIWNQYADYALEKKGVRFAEGLMTRWFDSVWHARVEQQNGKPGFEESSLSCPTEEFFGMLNLALCQLLQKNHSEARSTIDKALKLVSTEDFKHCVKEHASFLLSDGTYTTYGRGLVSLLNSYLVDVRYSPVSDPLSRRFLKNIKRPRIRHLINGFLGPVSFDCSLVNSILRLWFGDSLLPENLSKFKDLVEFVESLMELLLANYELALSVCKLITRSSNLTDISTTSALFWASSLLANSIFQALPIAPEQKWVETANVLGILELPSVSERFIQQAVSVYPFSVSLWKLYFNLSESTGNLNAVVEAAAERGITLNQSFPSCK